MRAKTAGQARPLGKSKELRPADRAADARPGAAGTWAAIEVRQVMTRSDDRFVPSKRFDVPIRWTRVNAAGALLIEIADHALWSLSADGSSWRQLR